MTDPKPITGPVGKMRERKFPEPQLIELSWDIKFSRWVQRIVEGIKRGYMSTQKYEQPYKKTIRRIIEFIEALTKVLAKFKK